MTAERHYVDRESVAIEALSCGECGAAVECDGDSCWHADPELNPHELAYVIPEGWTAGDLGTCRSCAAPVMWATTRSGAKNPINPDGVSHFATCPQASSWRRRKPVTP